MQAKIDRGLLRRLLHYLVPFKGWLAVAVLCMLISKGIEASIPLVLGKITQQIFDVGFVAFSLREILASSLFIVALLGFSYLLDTSSMLIKYWVGEKAIFQIRTQVFDHIQRLPIEFYNRNPIGRLITRTIHDIDQINIMFSESVVPIMSSSLLFVCMFFGILWLNWQVALFAFSTLPFVWWLTHRFRTQQRRCYDAVRTIVSAMNAFVQEHLFGFSTIRSFGIQKKEKKQFEQLNEDHYAANLESIHNFGFFIGGIDFLQSLVLILVFAGIVLLAPKEKGFEAGTYFTFSLYALMFFRPLGYLAERYNTLLSAIVSAERVFGILDQKTEPTAIGKKEENHEEVYEIIFDNVWFAYEEPHWVLQELSFTLKKGESIALVGMTGAGKTTIINLLLRFYEVQRGTITLNGKDIRSYSLESLRSKFSIVLQDPVIFSSSIANNISLYDPEISEKKIHTAAEYVSLKPKLQNATLTTKESILSSGEKQLVSLARAVVRENRMLILDEATANIDTKTEKAIQDTLRKILKQKTAFVIAHRLSTIRDVDRIFVLHDGLIKETGTHAELLKAQGIYEKLYRLQFKAEG